MSTEEILAAALALPEAERRALVERLAESLPDEYDDSFSDPDFQAELDRREAEIEAGTAKLIPGPEFLASLQARASRRAAG